MTATEEVNQKQNRRKRRFTLPFTLFGLIWEVGSAIFPFLYGQPTKDWFFNIILFPVYLAALIFNFLLSNYWPRALDETLIGAYLLGFAILIFCSLSIGFLIGITIDGLIAFFKPIGNDRG